MFEKKIKKLLLLAGLIFFLSTDFSNVFSDTTRITNGEDIGVVIVGTITNTDPKNNVALIKETATGKVKAVKLGYTVATKYKVIMVEKKYIVVNDTEKSSSNYMVYYSRFTGEFEGLDNYTGGTLATTSSYSEDGFERKDYNIKMSKSYKNRMLEKDLSKILMSAATIPEVQNGKVIGFRMTRITQGSIFDKAGIQDEDIFTEINGTKLDNAAVAIKLLNSLRNDPKIDVKIIRGGQPITMSLRID